MAAPGHRLQPAGHPGPTSSGHGSRLPMSRSGRTARPGRPGPWPRPPAAAAAAPPPSSNATAPPRWGTLG